MRLPRVRLTVRWMMLLVAIAVVLLAGVLALVRTRHHARLAAAYRAEAAYCAEADRHNREVAAKYEAQAAGALARGDRDRAERFRAEAARAKGYAATYGRWTSEYERAAARPWEPLPRRLPRMAPRPPRTAADHFAAALWRRGPLALSLILISLIALLALLTRAIHRQASPDLEAG